MRLKTKGAHIPFFVVKCRACVRLWLVKYSDGRLGESHFYRDSVNDLADKMQ